MAKNKRKVKIGDRVIRPESLMMSYGYKPEWSEGAIKTPIFQTATFSFEKAKDGKAGENDGKGDPKKAKSKKRHQKAVISDW